MILTPDRSPEPRLPLAPRRSPWNSRQVKQSAPPPPGFSSALYMMQGRMLFLRRGIVSAAHRHHAIQICLGLDGPIGFRDASGLARRARAFIIDHNCRHTIEAAPDRHAFLFVEPEMTLAREIRARHLPEGGISEFDFALCADFRDRLIACHERAMADGEIYDLLDGLLATLGGTPQAVPGMDDRIDRVLRRLAQSPSEDEPSPAELAHMVALSESRFQHLFKAHVGLPLREYLLWRRLIVASRLIAEAGSLTRAAHDAGFSDSAHFSRTFRRMFGVTASDVLKATEVSGGLALHVLGDAPAGRS